MLKKLNSFYQKYNVYIRVDVIMYLVMVILIGLAVAMIHLMKK